MNPSLGAINADRALAQQAIVKVPSHAWLAATKTKNTDCGDRTHDHEIKSLALYRTELSRLVGSMENTSQ